jgi:tRNA-splicing ligase RtcB
MGTLGSGNHYLEVQKVGDVFDGCLAAAFGIRVGDVVLNIHCGSRGLGHQIGTDFLKKMVVSAPTFGLRLPDRELACAPIHSGLGEEYFGDCCDKRNGLCLGWLLAAIWNSLHPAETHSRDCAAPRG